MNLKTSEESGKSGTIMTKSHISYLVSWHVSPCRAEEIAKHAMVSVIHYAQIAVVVNVPNIPFMIWFYAAQIAMKTVSFFVSSAYNILDKIPPPYYIFCWGSYPFLPKSAKSNLFYMYNISHCLCCLSNGTLKIARRFFYEST